jgi:hypothetical protein
MQNNDDQKLKEIQEKRTAELKALINELKMKMRAAGYVGIIIAAHVEKVEHNSQAAAMLQIITSKNLVAPFTMFEVKDNHLADKKDHDNWQVDASHIVITAIIEQLKQEIITHKEVLEGVEVTKLLNMMPKAIPE